MIDRGGDREIGLAGAGGPEAEHQLVLAQRLEVVRLAGAARRRCAACGCGSPRLRATGAGACRRLGLREAHRGIDRRRHRPRARASGARRARQRGARDLGRARRARRSPAGCRARRRRRRAARSMRSRCASRSPNSSGSSELSSNSSCMRPRSARSRGCGRRALKPHTASPAKRRRPGCWARRRDAHRHDRADRDRAARRGMHAAADRGCGRRAGPRCRPGFSNSTGSVRPTQAALNARCCSRKSACRRGEPLGLDRLRGSGRGIAAAGVPGRGLYLNEKAWAKPTSRTSASVASKSASLSPGKPTMKSDEKRDVGPRRAQPLDGAAIVGGGVPAVHRLQHAVRARTAPAGAGTASAAARRDARR